MALRKIAESIIYVGVNDKTIDLFENQYEMHNGVTYNSYVICDQKIAVLDTVDDRATDQWFDNLEEAFDGKAPDYLIVSHMEPDHAANIQRFLVKYPETVLVMTSKAAGMIPQFFDVDKESLSILEVQEGEELSLGKHTLKFIMAPMVHWPEVMVTYVEQEKILFSADAFGTFGVLSDDIFYDIDGKDLEQINKEWTDEAARYYLNIVGKYGPSVQSLLKKASGIDIKTIAPLHGPILKGDLSYHIDKYNKWSLYEPEEKGVVIAYSTLHGNTKNASERLAKELKEKGEKNIKIFDLSRCSQSEVLSYALRYDALVLAGVTYDAGIMPCMEDFLYHLKIKTFRNRYAALIENGSWASVAGKIMKSELEQMKNITICEEIFSFKSSLKMSEEQRLSKFAEKIYNRESI